MTRLLYVLNIKRNIFKSVLHIPALWYFGTSSIYPPWFHRVKSVVIPLHFILQQYLWNIAIQPAVGCYNSWANLWCSGCYPLGEKLLWNRSIWDVWCSTHFSFWHWVTAPSGCHTTLFIMIKEWFRWWLGTTCHYLNQCWPWSIIGCNLDTESQLGGPCQIRL